MTVEEAMKKLAGDRPEEAEERERAAKRAIIANQARTLPADKRIGPSSRLDPDDALLAQHKRTVLASTLTSARHQLSALREIADDGRYAELAEALALWEERLR